MHHQPRIPPAQRPDGRRRPFSRALSTVSWVPPLPLTWNFTTTVTATNPGMAPVNVEGYALVIYDAAGAEIFSTDHVPWGALIEPGKSDSGSYERGPILD